MLVGLAKNPLISGCVMNSVWRLNVLSLLLVCSWLCTITWSLPCHLEVQFVKVEGALQPMNSIKTATVAAMAFCSTECVDFPGCNSFAYLTASGTDNCQLSASVDGQSTTAASVVYKKSPALTAGCAGSPCLNGGTCVDICEKPYYICVCPSDKQGMNCEWDIACNVEDWEVPFDAPGTVQCSGTKTYMSGFGRNDCDELHCLNSAKCCPVPIEYSQEDKTCVVGDWWNTFGAEAWNNCPEGYYVTGFMREQHNNVGSLEEGVCCKPPSAPTHWGDCYIEDITSSFDVPMAQVGCHKPLHYIAAIHTHECDQISCMEELKCCQIALE